MPQWKCPRCATFIPFKDFDLVARPKTPAPYHCHACGLQLAVDKKTDELVAVPPEARSREKPPRKHR